MQVEITHSIEKSEMDPNGAHEFFYNFLDYRFDTGGRAVRARAYADDFRTVAIVTPGELDPSVVGYLADRFHQIQVLSAAGAYEPLAPARVAEIIQ